jgi:hypothetical protein
LILGLLLVPGYVVTPVLFAGAASSEAAGMLAGQIFHLVNSGLLLLAAALAFFWFRMASSGEGIGKVRWGLLFAVALLVAINEFALAPRIAEIKAHVGPIDQLAEHDPDRKLFGVWHGISASVHMLATACAALLVGLGARKAACRPDIVAGEPSA